MTDSEIISAAMKLLAQGKRATWRTCEQCGIRYQGKAHSRFCHPYCRRRAWKARKKRESVNATGEG